MSKKLSFLLFVTAMLFLQLVSFAEHGIAETQPIGINQNGAYSFTTATPGKYSASLNLSSGWANKAGVLEYYAANVFKRHYAVDGSINNMRFEAVVPPPACSLNAQTQNVTVQLDASGQATIQGPGFNTNIFTEDFSADPSSGANQTSLTNWDITTGNVDFGGFLAPLGSNSIDLAGNTDAIIVSKELLTLAPGTYQLSFELKDNTAEGTGDFVNVQVGSLFNQNFSATSSQVTQTATFTVNTNTTARIRFAQGGTNNASGSFIGDIKLALVHPASYSIENGSTADCGIASYQVSKANFTCADLGQNQVTLTITDFHGNQSTATATVTVEDAQNPTAIAKNISVSLDANGMVVVPATQVNDGSSDNCGIRQIGLVRGNDSFINQPITGSFVTHNNSEGHGQSFTASSSGLLHAISIKLHSSVTNRTLYIYNGATGSTASASVGSPIYTQTGVSLSGDGAGAQWTTVVLNNPLFVEAGQQYTFIIDGYTDIYYGENFYSGGTFVWNFSTASGCCTWGDLAFQVEIKAEISSSLTFSCADVGPQQRTLLVIDPSGNQASATATITVEDNTDPVALTKNVTLVLDATGNGTVTPAMLDNGSNDGCGAPNLSISQSQFDCSDIGALTTVSRVSDANWTQSSVELSTPTQFVSVAAQLPAASTYTIPVQNVYPYNGTLIFSAAVPGTQPIYSKGGTKFFKTNFNLTGQPSSLRIRARVDNYMEIFVNGQSIGLESSLATQNFTNTKYHDVYIDANGVQNGYLGGMQFDQVTSQNILALLQAGDNELVFAIGNTNGTDEGGFTVRLDAEAGGVPVVLTATDNAGNSNTATGYVLVEDRTAPVMVTNSLSVNLTSRNAQVLTQAQIDQLGANSSDNCGLTFTISNHSFDCSSIGQTYTLTLTGTDPSGNFASVPVSVTVTDNNSVCNDPPVAVCAPFTAYTGANCTATITAADVDGGSIDPDGDALTYSLDNYGPFGVGTHTVTLTVSDGEYSRSCSATVTVFDQTAPLIQTQNATVQLDQNGNGSIAVSDVLVSATDACGILSETLSISTFSCQQVGSNNVVVTVTDVNGRIAQNTVTVMVLDVLPIQANADVFNLNTCAPFTFTQAQLLGNDSDPYNQNLKVDFVGTPGNGTIVDNNDGTYTYTPNSNTNGTDTASYIVKRDDGTVVFANNGHFYEFVPASEITWAAAKAAAEQRTYNGQQGYLVTITSEAENQFAASKLNGQGWIGASDAQVEGEWRWVTGPESGTLFYQGNVGGTAVNGAYNSWAGGEPNDFVSSGYFVDGEDFAHFLTDGRWNDYPNSVGGNIQGYVVEYGGLAGDCTIPNAQTGSITFNLTDNVLPVASAQNITVQLDANGQASIAAADVDNGSNDACGIANRSVSPSSFDCSNVGDNTVTLTVTDNNGNIASTTATVTVEDGVNPQAIAQNITVQLDANGQVSIAAADVDNGSNDACGIANMSVSPSSFDCSNVGNNTVTFTVTDNNGNIASTTATVTVEDGVNPQAIAKNIAVQLDVNGQVSIAAADVDNGSKDACGIANLSVSPSSFDCSTVGVNAVVLTVTDNNGNISTAQATVTVQDQVLPQAIAQNITVQLNANGQVSIAAADVDNGSNDACGIANRSVSPSSFDCSNVGDNTVTLTVTDNNGNTSTAQATVTVQDQVLPQAIAKNIVVQLDANGQVGITAADVDNGSNDACGIASVSVSPSSFDCSNTGANTVTLTVMDNHGNMSTNTATVTVEDNITPTITQVPDVSIVSQPNDCSPMVSWTAPVAADNCSFSVSSTHNPGDRFNEGVTIVTYTVTDASGNQAQSSFTVTVTPTPLSLSAAAATYVGGWNVSCKGAADGSIDATVGGGCLPYTYSWSNGSNAEDINGLSAGSYTLTVTDATGRTISTSVTLSEPQPLSVSATATGFNNSAGFSGSTIYLGYGNQSVNLDASAMGGTAGYQYTWSPAASLSSATGATVVASPMQSTTYTVVVTDQNGCTASYNLYVDVVDARCGNKLDKVIVCHRESKSKKGVTTVSYHEICVSPNAVAAHLAHGDYVGPCENNSKNEILEETLEVAVYPNPTNGSFNVRIHAHEEGAVHIAVFSMNGQLVRHYGDKAVDGNNEYYIDLTNEPAGLYMVKVETAEGVSTTKLIKE